MTRMQWTKIACAGVVSSAIGIAGTLSYVPRVTAQNGGGNGDSRVQIGMAAAPVHLNMAGKNPAQVGLGSYLVNVAGDCNGCHFAGPQTEYAFGGNPYFGQTQ